MIENVSPDEMIQESEESSEESSEEQGDVCPDCGWSGWKGRRCYGRGRRFQ